MSSEKFPPRSKVKCVSKENVNPYNEEYVEIGKIYTISDVPHLGCSHEITLVEVDEKHPERPFFDDRDFELAIDTFEDYDRAMSII